MIPHLHGIFIVEITQGASPRPGLGKASERFAQVLGLRSHGNEAMRHDPYLGYRLARRLLDRRCVVHKILVEVRQLAPERLRNEADTGESLSEIVMELTADSAPLFAGPHLEPAIAIKPPNFIGNAGHT
jgi:hypothetical protein